MTKKSRQLTDNELNKVVGGSAICGREQDRGVIIIPERTECTAKDNSVNYDNVLRDSGNL